MKSFTSRFLLSPLFLLLSVVPHALRAQLEAYEKTKEKIYIHTNHVFFKPGEAIFFKMYLVDARTQLPSSMSQKMYVDILAPSGNLLEKQSYYVSNGAAEGSYEINPDAVGGVYKLKAYTAWMQNESDSTFYSKEITVQKILAPRVLMKLEFPQKGYGAGDEVVADFSMRSLKDQPIRGKEAKYTVSVAGESIATATFTTDRSGKAQLRFTLPKNLVSNDGLLNITVVHDANTESISRSIPIVLNKVDLQFMPEGGSWVGGISTRIAFKALDDKGKPVDVKGDLLDANGTAVAHFESTRFGMGSFAFTPQAGVAYVAAITVPANIAARYPLPIAKANGVVLNMDRTEKGLFAVLKCSENSEGIYIVLEGQCKGVGIISWKNKLKAGELRLPIDEKLFPMGIARFTVSSFGLPLAERLVFMNSEKNIHATVTTDKTLYLPREKVKMHLKTVDDEGKPVAANFSVSVVDDKLWSYADDKQDHILSWLLLSSELNGIVEEPQFYFKKEEAQAPLALDLVMMTNGYRYFEYTDFVSNNKTLNYLPEKGASISGIVLDNNKQPVKNASVYVVAERRNTLFKKETDTVGAFIFNELPEGETIYLYATAKKQTEKLSIQLDNAVRQQPVMPRRMVKKGVAANEMMAPMAANLKEKQEGGDLDEVIVVGYAAEKKKNLIEFGSAACVGRNIEVNMDERNVENALAGKIIGVQVIGNDNLDAKPNIVIRGASTILNENSPLYVIDGVPLKEGFPIDALNPNDIENIVVLNDASSTALYGSKAANGVVIIKTKDAHTYGKLNIDLAKNSSFATMTVRTPKAKSNITVARKFYAPIYQSLKTTERTDFRENIYWNPIVQTNKDGNADFEFYNSDANTTFRTIAEGIAANGWLGRAEATYAVQNALALDAKIPPYLTVGDKALLPLNLKNNTHRPIELTISATATEGFVIGSFSQNITLAKGEAQQILVPLEAVRSGKGTVRFAANAEVGSETLVLPIEAADKGFAMSATCAGTTSGKANIPVKNLVPGSLTTELKLFRSLEGQLLDGIESMLREPHGCFEQTSSTTYPNVFILKYLRESGKSNSAIEKKAMDYIQRGYQKLVGFETSENGFEWFGNAPAHEALTAYGLLEFTDMQNFIDVDKKMLERTKAFLLKRRDGNGGFQIKSGGYERFASVPGKIANTYIVYALTQAGVGNEIKPEYTATIKKAMESKDAYQLAMMAIAASNMKDDKSFSALMALLQERDAKADLASETSVVNSRDVSLKVEAMALYVLALAREQQPDLVKMASLLSKIVSSKSYYGYGSTQATVLALNAVVTYSKLVAADPNTPGPAFSLNQQPMQLGNKASGLLKDGDNQFSVTYNAGAQAVPYSFQVNYHTFTPPNSPKAVLQLNTQLATAKAKVGETVRMDITITNKEFRLQPMAIAKIGIPAGLSLQTWQLKEIMDKHEAAYYEIFDNYLVFYWMGFAPKETKTLHLDLKAEVPGTYRAKSSNVYLYYTPEHKHWNDGLMAVVGE